MRSTVPRARRSAVALVALALTAAAAILFGAQTTSAAPARTATSPSLTDPTVAEVPVTREAAYGDNRFTVFRPTDPQSVDHALPVLAFGNGACAHNNNSEVTQALTFIASQGYVVVDTGSADGSSTGVPDGTPIPSLLTDAISWAEQEQERADSPLYQNLDLSKVATAGHSCGGIEALVAAQDDRVSAVVSLNSGLFEDGSFGYPRSELQKLHTPVLFLDGGPSDIAYDNSQANYDLVSVPAVKATQPDAGHVGFITGYQMTEGQTVLVAFLNMVLFDDQEARDYILDPGGLASQSPWSVANKNF